MDSAVVEVRAVVRSREENAVWVEIDQQGCGRCQEPGGCGGQQLTQALCTTPKTYRIPTQEDLHIGDRVRLGIPAQAVRKGATLAYVLPLGSLLIGALLGAELAGDLGAIAGGCVGLCGAWLLVRLRLKSAAGNSEVLPHILSRV